MPIGMPTFSFVVMVGILLFGSIFDLRWRRLPNPLTVGGGLIGMILAFWQGGLYSLGESLLGLSIGFLLLLPGYIARFTGGGDVKLMAAVGSFLGLPLILYAFFLYVLAGLCWALVYSLFAWVVQGADPPFSRYWAMLRTLLRTGRVAYVRPRSGEAMGKQQPMAPAIAFGAIAAPLLFPV